MYKLHEEGTEALVEERPGESELLVEEKMKRVAGGPLRVRNFALLFGGQTISVMGDVLYLVALPWLVLTTGGSAQELGIVLATYGIPRALSMLLGGWLSDRLRPRRVMLVADAVRMLLVGLLAALALGGIRRSGSCVRLPCRWEPSGAPSCPPPSRLCRRRSRPMSCKRATG